ncbi:HD-GYP domain-containing protein [Mesobacillus subterraneus]|uniref:HD-GYP domain-containing protein n=1 Tax=Mesobacillus subterraneus TaxID=285983 RepID=A0A3R9FET5_9BACI|nr:HD-GYP domain-containing protein [Mesobacillus subterraneus]RSD26398.1 HD-GYP domain-containing protein [Mesobacillus subterraneus]
MRLIATTSAGEGALLGKAIYNDQGQILLNAGARLEKRILSRLSDFGIDYIYIKDPDTDDIILTNSISDEMRVNAIKTIGDTFKQVQLDSKISHTFVLEKSARKFKKLISILLEELRESKELLNLLSDVFLHDHYIFSHSLNVTLYALAIGIEMKLPPKELEQLGLGAILHDVGKMKVPEEILSKPGKLTAEEFQIIKAHAEDGFQLLRNIPTVPLIVAHCAFQHHERMNGAGYPRGLKGEEIHLFGRILGVADVFDAVTSNRVYRPAMLPHEGLEILYSGSGSLFDAKVVDAFRKAVAIYPVGLTVLLSDGRRGVVSAQNPGLSERPMVRILEENGRRVEPYELDLKTNLSLMIASCDTIIKYEYANNY